jgi:hypothetical protein
MRAQDVWCKTAFPMRLASCEAVDRTAVDVSRMGGSGQSLLAVRVHGTIGSAQRTRRAMG